MMRLDFGKPTQEKEQAFAHIPRTSPTLTELLCQIIMKLSDLGRALARFLGDRKREDTMPNIQDYVLWRGDLPLERVPLCDVDALLLSYLSYMPYDHIAGDAFDEGISLRDAARKLLEVNERDKTPLAYNVREDRKLLAALMESARFRDIRLVGYVNKVDPEQEEQFAAVTYLLGEGRAFVAFRGTDNTVVGWKEDFNMSFETEVPAQRDAVAYAQHVAKAIDLPLIVGGHSKGGNLAAYAGMFVDEATRARIQTVYNFDGPGFNEATISSEEFGKVDMRIRTFVPQSSMIGILMWHREPFTIVRSNGVGVFQHDAYTWQIMGGDFIKLSERTGHSHFADDTIKRWLEELKPDMRRQAIDGIYAVLSASNGMNVSDLFEARNTMSVLKAAGAMDEKTRSAVMEAFRLLGSSMIGGVPAWLERTASSMAQKMPWEQRREEARAEAKMEARAEAKTEKRSKTGSETGLKAGTEAEARENAPELAK